MERKARRVTTTSKKRKEHSSTTSSSSSKAAATVGGGTQDNLTSSKEFKTLHITGLERLSITYPANTELFLTRPQQQYRVVLFVVRFIVHFVIAGLLLLGAFGKALRNGNTSLEDYVRHFTNWAWTLHTVYFTITLLSNTLFIQLRYLNSFMISFFYFGLQGIAWSVAVLVYVFIGINAEFIEQYMKSFGGNTSDSTVLLGNAFYHGFPVLFYLLYSIAYQKDIWLAMHWELNEYPASLLGRVFFAIYNIYLIPVLYYGSYLLFFDPKDVYNIDTPWWVGLLVVVGTITLVSAPAYYFYTPPADIRKSELHAVNSHSLRHVQDVEMTAETISASELVISHHPSSTHSLLLLP
jgi:hypothetical protein